MGTARIMVVEDESIIALDIESRLRKLGYDVVAIASTGSAAVDKAAETRPDLVLMDIRLKGEIDGIDAAGHIRTENDIPIVYLTAYADDATLARAKMTPPHGYLLKPFEERQLRITLETALYRHEMERKLRCHEQWLNTVLRSIGEGVIATDADDRIRFMNPVAATLTGYDPDTVQGKKLATVFKTVTTRRSPAGKGAEDEVAWNPVPDQLEERTLLIARDGRQIPIDYNASPIVNRDEQANGSVIVFRDVSQRDAAEETIRHYTAELRVRNDELDAFAYTTAHDLTSLLGPIVGFAEYLVAGHEKMSAAEVEEYLRIIAKNGRKMVNVIDELLLLSQVRRMDVQMEQLDMAGIVNGALERLAFVIDEHNAEIIIPETWPSALGYGPWIEEVWINYLSNAIKYGGDPPVVELGADPAQDGFVRFWIRDNGAGLSEEEQAQLFRPFTRLKQVRASGTGLGLSIVHRILQKLGGAVGVEQNSDQGSTFSFSLPAFSGEESVAQSAALADGQE